MKFLSLVHDARFLTGRFQLHVVGTWINFNSGSQGMQLVHYKYDVDTT